MTAQGNLNRLQLKALLDDEIKTCRRCDDMNEIGVTQAAPGWGNLDSAVAIVGQSLCEQCMKREPPEPFYEKSGTLLDRAYPLGGCEKSDLFITNAVHCHPRDNRASYTHEIVNCSPYLFRELEIVRPRLVIALGDDALRVVSFFYPKARMVQRPFTPPKYALSKKVPCIYHVTHPSSVKRKHDQALEAEWVSDVAEAIRWARAKGSLREHTAAEGNL
jgi:DNA polymerase